MQFHGMLAGILSKIGKISLVICFCFGNIGLFYFAKENSTIIIMIREILIASFGLLFIPKNIDFEISDILGKTKFLPVTGENKLEEDKTIIYKLNSLDDLNERLETVLETEDEMEIESKKIFIKELYKNIENLSENLIYEDIMSTNELIIENIYDVLEKQNEIKKEEIIEILEENNNYIITIDGIIDENVENDLEKMVKTINQTYKKNKVNLIWKKQKSIKTKK